MKLKLPPQINPIARTARKAPGLAYDCELAARIKDGDRAALKQIVDRHIGRLHSYLLHRLGEGHDETIDKVVAATFDNALRRIGPYASGAASTPMDLWLIRLAERNLSHVKISPEAKPAESTSDLTRFRAALAAIPGRYRPVMALAVFEQLPPVEIAQALGVSQQGAMRKLRAALKRTGKALEKQQAQESD